MKVIDTTFKEVKIFEPKVFLDDRGSFYESFRDKDIKNALQIDINFCQENESFSKKNVFRGLHYQKNPLAQSKLVRVVQGEVIDIIVDMRKNSNTFLQSESFNLSAKNKKQLFIPQGFAHGFLTLSNTAIFSYKVDNYYSQEHDRGINIFDPQLKIELPIEKNLILMSEKDSKLPFINSGFEFF